MKCSHNSHSENSCIHHTMKLIALLLLTCTLVMASGAAYGGFHRKGRAARAAQRSLNRKGAKGKKEKGTKMPSYMPSMNPTVLPTYAPSSAPTTSPKPSTSQVPSLAPSKSMEPTCIDNFRLINNGKGGKGGKGKHICDSSSPSQAPSISYAPSISSIPSTSPSTSNAPSLSGEPSNLPSTSSPPSSMPSCGKGKGCASNGTPKKSRNNADPKGSSPSNSNENNLSANAKSEEASGASNGNFRLATAGLVGASACALLLA